MPKARASACLVRDVGPVWRYSLDRHHEVDTNAVQRSVRYHPNQA